MKKLIGFVLIGTMLLIAFPTVVFASGAQEAAESGIDDDEYDQWLQQAELGPYQPDEEDVDAIYDAARQEPTLRIHMTTSRVHDMIEVFREEWPGVDVEGDYTSGANYVDLAPREWNAGVFNEDVVSVSGLHYARIFPEGLATPYVPTEMADNFAPEHKEPVLTMGVSHMGWFYNDQWDGGGQPFDNVWALTEPEFSGRILVEDPLLSATHGYYFAMMAANPSDLETAYENYYGESYSDADSEERNAGYEWLRRLLENDVQVVPSWRDMIETISGSNQPLVGLGNFLRMDNVVEGELEFSFAMGVDPIDAVHSDRWLAIGGFSDSPNAAKLFIRTVLGVEGGRSLYDRGFQSTQIGWEPRVEWMERYGITDINAYGIDVDFMIQEYDDVLDAWLIYGP